MRKLLYIPFYSQQDKTNGKILLNADANMRVMKMLFSILKEFFEIHVVVPSVGLLSNENDILIFDDAKWLQSLNVFPNNMIQRFHFDAFEYCKIFDGDEYDLIINNTPELTKNILSCYKYVTGKFTHIISINHFPMINEFHISGHDQVISYEQRQHESLFCSSLSVVFSKYIREIYLDEGPCVDEQISQWPLSFDSKEIASHFNDKQFFNYKSKNEVRFVFPNRLSTTNYSNHIPFIEGVKIFARILKTVTGKSDFSIAFTNTTKSVSKEWLMNNVPNCICPDTFDRKDYLKLLASSDFSISLMDDLHGGIAVREGMALGCLPIIRNIHSFGFTIPENYPLFVKSLEPTHIAAVLHNAYLMKSNCRSLYESFYKIFDDEDFGIVENKDKIICDVLRFIGGN